MHYARVIVACVISICAPFLLVAQTHHHCPCCGTIPYPSDSGYVTPDPIIDSPEVWSFVSEPNLHPMKVSVNTYEPGTSSGLIFLAPYSFSSDATYGQPGSLILDNEGTPFWFRPLEKTNLMNTDFRVQTFKEKKVLTFWQGSMATPPAYTNAPGGSSEPGSCYYILDHHYQVIKTIKAQKGFTSDIHEFLITPQNTALFLSTKTVPMDLTPYGGAQDSFVQDFAVQEVDIETNELLFFWSALDHIPLIDSYEPASSASSTGNIWDAYHCNAIGLTEDEDDIIVSSRNAWTIYRINKPTGNIVWRLGGKQSDFTIEEGADFSWQHDSRLLPDSRISLFDDNCCESGTIPPGTLPARGLVLQLDFETMTAALDRSYYHDPNLQVASQGNVQTLSNGHRFIGWGQTQYYAEYDEAGNTIDNPIVGTLYDAKMAGSNYTYRAYRYHWKGFPCYLPSIAARATKKRTKVYASWNGSTETVGWQLFAGRSANNLSKVKTVGKDGFETVISVASCGPYFQVKALNCEGEVIGESEIVKVCAAF